MGNRAETAAFALGCRVGSLQGPLIRVNSLFSSSLPIRMAQNKPCCRDYMNRCLTVKQYKRQDFSLGYSR